MNATLTPGTRRSRRSAARLLGLAIAMTVVLSGCATKRDLRDLRDELVSLQLRQDSMFRETQLQNRLLLDTLRSGFAAQLDQRGETSHRFAQLDQNLARLEEMVTQTQLLMAQLNERLANLTAAPPPALGDPAAPVGGLSAGEARTMYEAGVEKMQEGAYSTARAAFEALLEQYQNDPLAPEAQYQLAETYYLEDDHARAIEELEKVERQWPRAPRAPVALLRAGVISEEQGERDAARAYYQQVRQRFPSSDAAREAERRLDAIR